MFLKTRIVFKNCFLTVKRLHCWLACVGQNGILRGNPKGGLSKRSASFSRLNGNSQKWDSPQNLNTPKQQKWDPI